jgi:hypothetical protein
MSAQSQLLTPTQLATQIACADYTQLEGTPDYLFIDDAGQMSLAHALAAARAARNVLLLGLVRNWEEINEQDHYRRDRRSDRLPQVGSGFSLSKDISRQNRRRLQLACVLETRGLARATEVPRTTAIISKNINRRGALVVSQMTWI